MNPKLISLSRFLPKPAVWEGRVQCKNNGLIRNSTWELIDRVAKQTGVKVTARAGPVLSHQLPLFVGGFVFRLAHRGNWLNHTEA